MEHVFATIPPSLVETARRITAPSFANWTWELTTAPLGSTRQVDALGVVDRMSGPAGTFWQAVIDQELDEELYDADDLTDFYAGVTVVVWETDLERNADVHAEILDHYGYVFTPPEPTIEAVEAEMMRRVHAGRAFNIVGVPEPVTLQGDTNSKTDLVSLLTTAQNLKAAGLTDFTMKFTDRARVRHLMTPDQMIALVQAGQDWVQANHDVADDMTFASGVHTSGIPYNYTDDSYWPE